MYVYKKNLNLLLWESMAGETEGVSLPNSNSISSISFNSQCASTSRQAAMQKTSHIHLSVAHVMQICIVNHYILY